MGMEILLLSALMVGVPVMIIGFVAAWRERHYLVVLVLPETMSSHTFPYDLLYICPALRPRQRCPRSLIARPRSLPRTKR